MTAQRIADHFASVKTMTGEFIQFGPWRADRWQVLHRAARQTAFNYEAPSPIRVIADGKNVVIGNKKLRTWDVYPLGKTPLKLLLADRIDLSAKRVRESRKTDDLTTIVLATSRFSVIRPSR
jgi:outer membrane lipoprotein-sorting protein